MPQKEPSEYIKFAIGVYTVLISSAVIWLFTTVSELTGENREQNQRITHLEQGVPRMSKMVEDNTRVLRELEKMMQKVITILEDRTK